MTDDPRPEADHFGVGLPADEDAAEAALADAALTRAALAHAGSADETTAEVTSYDDLAAAFDQVEAFLLGDPPSLTRVEVAARAGVPLELAKDLWRLLGFAHRTDEDVAFAESDVQALRMTVDLMRMGILDEESQSALVRTWGRSYARLAEWQVSLLAGHALEGPDPDVRLAELAAGVLPRVEALQAYVWRRHLASAASRLLMNATSGTPEPPRAVCFVDIVGYTTHSKTMGEAALVEWIERFEQDTTGTVTDHGGQVIKTIGDEILFTADDPVAAVEVALELTARGTDEADPFPAVRAGLAYGEVVTRLGDVFGPTVNIAARLTSIARPGTLVVDRGAYDALSGAAPADRHEEADDAEQSSGPEDQPDEPDAPPYKLRRLRRVSVKGYARLEAWSLRPRRSGTEG